MNKITTLVPLSEFVLHLHSLTTSELCKIYPKRFRLPEWKGSKDEMVKDMLAIEAIKYDMVKDYTKFLIKTLEIGFFVPTDNEGNVLEDCECVSDNGCCVKRNEYQQAKSKILFEGFEIDEVLNVNYKELVYVFFYDKGSRKWNTSKGIINLESLSIYGDIPLTEQALKQIYG